MKATVYTKTSKGLRKLHDRKVFKFQGRNTVKYQGWFCNIKKMRNAESYIITTYHPAT